MIAASLRARFDSLSTGVKMLVIMTLALLPLGIVALLASIQANTVAGEQRRIDLRIAATDSARELAATLGADIAAMRVATNALALGGSADESCARLATAVGAGTRASFALFATASAPVCASPGFAATRPSTVALELAPRTDIVDDSFALTIPATNGAAVAVARYHAATLRHFARPSPGDRDVRLGLENGAGSLTLVARQSAPRSAISETATVGQLGLTLTVARDERPFDTPSLFFAFLPLLMWASAAIIAFLLTERLLIRPLSVLRDQVAVGANQPLTFGGTRTPAREIRELGDTFANSQRAMTAQQAALTSALADQMRATREVHHRVKNNLQIIASLINLHARAATSADAIGAYAAIQRRVDALAIVHRNHYAELDAAAGIDLRRLFGEVAANLRAGLGNDGTHPTTISLASGSVAVAQDTAIALAFLMTELIELANAITAKAEIAVSVTPLDAPGRAMVTVRSVALRTTPALEDKLALRYARVIEGLARQLRAPIQRNKRRGSFAIEFATVPHLN